MDQLVACPDCGTSNRSDADLCAQCWRELNDGAIGKIPAAAFAVTAAGPATLAPPPPASPRYKPVPPPEPVAPEPRTIEAVPGPVPYFAPVTGSAPPPSYSPPMESSSSPTSASKAPWGVIVMIALVLAVAGGGYFFLAGRSAAAFSPEDGAYSVVLPEGWQRAKEVEAMRGEIDVAVKSEAGESGIFVGHWPVPGGVTAEQFRAGMNFAKQFMPQLPGVTLGSFQESTAVAAEGVTAFEMTASVNGGLLTGRGRLRTVLAIRDGAPSFVLMLVACPETECATAEPAFQEMVQTLEVSD